MYNPQAVCCCACCGLQQVLQGAPGPVTLILNTLRHAYRAAASANDLSCPGFRYGLISDSDTDDEAAPSKADSDSPGGRAKRRRSPRSPLQTTSQKGAHFTRSRTSKGEDDLDDVTEDEELGSPERGVRAAHTLSALWIAPPMDLSAG